MSFYGGSRLPFASLHNSPKLPKRFPAAPRRHSGRGEPSCSSNKSLKPWQCPFMEVQGCRLPGFKTCQNSPNASLQLPGATQAAVNLSCSSNKSLKPWQCSFMEVQGCRLPGFKTRQNSPNASLQLPGATQAAVNLSCSSNKSLKPWQCPFMAVQGCRLPFARLQNSPKLPKRFPAAPRRHSGRGEPFLQLQQVPEAVFKTRQNSPNASLQLPGATQAAVNLSCSSNKSSLQNSPKLSKRFPAAPRRHSGRGEPFLQLQQVPEAVAMSFYGGSRLPFARIQNSPKLPKRFPAAPRRQSGRGEPFLQLQQVPEAVAVSF